MQSMLGIIELSSLYGMQMSPHLLFAVILLSYGTGPVKGFAITLSIGIITSMFTAIMGTRAFVNLIYGSKKNLEDYQYDF